ncbi:VOC family protein [Amycolatopsis sp. Hca4]|uniref:VOC family protein n=1 Tax=Amycolatopsis sp. Hca4 TaxID=2742131 RepID=UPI00158FE717|nr:VOC family protein [Amycolatopsis sp. Hca4]QKV73132.1 VOC family protein [Amycolatopsis sp. Hca4]
MTRARVLAVAVDCRKPELLAEVERLVMLGAKVLDDPPDDPWIVLADPEGNEFCVLPAR